MKRTGPTPAVRAQVLARAGGRCELCGCDLAASWSGYSLHHRLPRRMGGRKGGNEPSNLLALCGSGVTGCHGLVERNRHAALERGCLLHENQDPAATPVRLRRGLVLLRSDHYEPVAA